MQTPAPAAPTIPQPTPGQTGTGTQSLLSPAPQVPDAGMLRARRSELSRQLNSAEGRRNELAQELKTTTDGVVREGIEARIRLLNDRIVSIETQIAENGRLIAATAGTESTQEEPMPPGMLSSEQITGISIVFIIMVLAPLAFAAARLMWRRATVRIPKESPEVGERLARLEQAVDAVAIEVERISEGQRYVTRVLVGDVQPAASPERGRPALGAGQQPAEPIQMPVGERVGRPRRER